MDFKKLADEAVKMATDGTLTDKLDAVAEAAKKVDLDKIPVSDKTKQTVKTIISAIDK